MTRKECLEQAMGCVLRDRQKQYGEPENNFERIAQMWNGYLGIHGIKPWDVAAMMGMLKMARARFNPKYTDNWVDLAGYAACGIECATAQEEFDKALGEAQKKSMEHMFKKAEGDAKAEDCEEPEFKPGDAVEWNGVGKNWLPAVYLREFGDFGHCVVQMDGRERIVSKVDLRRPEANYPENPDSSTEAKPEFKRGDKVQYLPSQADSHWCDAVFQFRFKEGVSVVKDIEGEFIWVRDCNLRPAPKAEGCEALVEKDAPQTPEKLCQHIVDCNPSTFGRPRTPTGEELAEMAEEEKRG